MPIKTTLYTVSATPKFFGEDPPEYDWDAKIELKINSHALSPKQCSQLQQQLVEMISTSPEKFDDFSSSTRIVSWETKTEVEEKLRQKVAKRFDDLAFDEDDAPRLRDLLVDEEQAKSWPISGKELEITNELLVQYGFAPLEKEELKV